MKGIKIKKELLPERCEICHQIDLFDAQNNYCARCSTVAPEHITLPAETNNTYATIIDWLQKAVFIGIWLLISLPLISSYFNDQGEMFIKELELVPLVAALTTIMAIIWRFYLPYKLMPLLMMIISSLLMILKPIIAPMSYSYEIPGVGMRGNTFSLTSETHLYFLIPGILMMIVSLVLIMDLFVNQKTFMKKGVRGQGSGIREEKERTEVRDQLR